MRPVNQPPVPPSFPAPDAAGHLPLPLLRQYVAGALPAAEQHRVEAHTLHCSRCAEVLDGLQLTDPATTDQALAELRHRLHHRLAQETTPQRGWLAWQAVAAAVLVLLVSSAAWFMLRPAASSLEPGTIARQEVPASAPVAPQARSLPAPPAEQPAAVANAPTVAAAPPVAAKPAPTTARRVSPRRTAPPPPSRPDLAAVQVPSPPPATLEAAEPAADAPAPAVAMSRAAAAPAKAEVAAAPVAASSPTADTLPAPMVAAKAKRAVAEEGAARKAALPPAAVIKPQPVGGYISLNGYLHREAKFRPEPPAMGLSGTVHVRFTVTAAGKLENFRITRSLRPDYDQEAIRLLCDGPAWQPGATNGRRADQVVDISVSF